ncbi:hypothetical protein HORIV_35210 [Vreelandella olivaria]|uniref:Uncharacterized protein n=1 Tax=Vreelandella olivaria TaxID=390919 RepID=A0ABN5WW48_9GAMM|nr:hypothetical protein HORIV_35210 [Halomonas olivaria]
MATAIDEGTSVEATGLALFKAAQDRGISLQSMRADGQGAPSATPPKDDTEATERAEGSMPSPLAGSDLSPTASQYH